MPANCPYDPRYNAKLYTPKLTEAQRQARATPLESLRRPLTQPADSAALSAPPQNMSPQRENPAVPTAEVPILEPASLCAPTPDDIPAAWEVVFAQFPEIYPDYPSPVLATVAAPGNQRASSRANSGFWRTCGLGRSIIGPRTNATGHEMGGDWSGAP